MTGTVPRARPAWYALARGGWRDYVTLLHPPYTAWHLAYVVIGGCLARAVAWDRLAALYRTHVRTARRSVSREEPPALPGESVLALADRLVGKTSGPSTRLRRAERRALVRRALGSRRIGDICESDVERGRGRHPGNRRDSNFV